MTPAEITNMSQTAEQRDTVADRIEELSRRAGVPDDALPELHNTRTPPNGRVLERIDRLIRLLGE